MAKVEINGCKVLDQWGSLLFIYLLCWAVDVFGSCAGIFSVVVDNVIFYFVILYIYGNYI